MSLISQYVLVVLQKTIFLPPHQPQEGQSNQCTVQTILERTMHTALFLNSCIYLAAQLNDESVRKAQLPELRTLIQYTLTLLVECGNTYFEILFLSSILTSLISCIRSSLLLYHPERKIWVYLRSSLLVLSINPHVAVIINKWFFLIFISF